MDEIDLTIRNSYLPATLEDPPPAPKRVAAGTSTKTRAVPPPIPVRARPSGTVPPPLPEPEALRPIDSLDPCEDDEDLEGPTPLPDPVAPADEPHDGPLLRDALSPTVLPPLPAPSPAWLDAIAGGQAREDEAVPTTYFEKPELPPTRQHELLAERRRWLPYAIACGAATVVVTIVTYFALGHHDAAGPAPAPAKVVAPAAAPAPAPAKLAFASVPISSTPPGATVALIVDGQATVIGQTPIVASIDPARSYDVMLAAKGLPSRIEHLPAGARELVVDLEPVPPPPAPAPAPARAKKAIRKH